MCHHGPVLALLLLLACPPDPVIEEVEQAPTAEAAVPLPLYEQLYAGERGPAVRAGDRVRLLVWLKTLAPSPVQVRSLAAAHAQVAVTLQALRASEAEHAAREAETLEPIYAAIEQALASGAEAEQLDVLATTLAAARDELPHPGRERIELARVALHQAAELVTSLDDHQLRAMQHALFLLRPQADALGAADTWELLVGEGWREQDFASLRRLTRPSEEPGSVDVAGLFELEEGAIDPTDTLEGSALHAVMALVLAHEELPAALALYGSP